jgi:hypothetical protein
VPVVVQRICRTSNKPSSMACQLLPTQFYAICFLRCFFVFLEVYSELRAKQHGKSKWHSADLTEISSALKPLTGFPKREAHSLLLEVT